MGPLWHTFVSSLKVYERSSIEGVEDSYDGRYDSDGAEKSLESFVIQVSKFVCLSFSMENYDERVNNNQSLHWWWLLEDIVSNQLPP